MKGKGVNNLSGFSALSPSPRPSPLKGEGVFLILYDSVKDDKVLKSEISSPGGGEGEGGKGRGSIFVNVPIPS